MVYLEQALPPYSATPAGCSLRQRYPYHPIPLENHTVPHWDVKTKRPQPVLPIVIKSQCGNSNKLALQQANFVPYDRLLQNAYCLLEYEKPPVQCDPYLTPLLS